MRTAILHFSLALPLACAGFAASARDDPAATIQAEAGRTTAGIQSNTAEPPRTPFAAAAVDDLELKAIAGRDDTRQVALNEQSARVSQSSVGDNATTGEARVDGNAFQNMTGMSILNINTGNNVAINAAMTVNISIQSGP